MSDLRDDPSEPLILASYVSRHLRSGAALVLISHGVCVQFACPYFHLRFGWGYDAELPLSLLPRASVGVTPAGRGDACLAWLGFYVGGGSVRSSRSAARDSRAR